MLVHDFDFQTFTALLIPLQYKKTLRYFDIKSH